MWLDEDELRDAMVTCGGPAAADASGSCPLLREDDSTERVSDDGDSLDEERERIQDRIWMRMGLSGAVGPGRAGCGCWFDRTKCCTFETGGRDQVLRLLPVLL